MKKLLLHIILCFSVCVSSAYFYGQNGYILNNLTQTNTTTTLSCDSTITMSFSAQSAATTPGTVPADIQNIIIGANFVPSQFQIQINWGDGVITTHNASTSSVATFLSCNPPAVHTYSANGTYQIVVVVYNYANQTSATSQINYTIGCGGGNTMCAGGQVFCDTDTNGVFSAGDIAISSAPITLSYNGITYTAYTNISGFYSLSYPGTQGQAAIITINSNWLIANGYSTNSNTFTILNAGCNGGSPAAIANFPVNCGANPAVSTCFAGNVFCDANGNGIMDNNENPITGAPITLTSQNQGGANTVTVYSDTNGYFIYCGAISNVNYVMAAVNQQWLAANGYTMNNNIITLVGANNAPPNPGNFAITCGVANPCGDMWTTVTPWIGYYQNTTAYIKLNWGSYGFTNVGTYALTLTFPAGVTLNTASIFNPGYVVAGNTITWNLNAGSSVFNLNDVITFQVGAGIANGTNHMFTSTITPTGSINDCSNQNNNGSLSQIIGNSYDPNDKVVVREVLYDQQMISPEIIDASIIDNLTYTIRFQNTGTAPAQNVYILDTLDANLDWTTFSLIEATHNLQIVNLGNGILRFEFPSIWLADSTTNEPASHGHLVYRIQENTNNLVGSTIENTAYIYFDWNAPIITNTTYNVNVMLWGIDESSMNQFKLYPNPSADNISITGNVTNFAYKILDMSGRELVSGQGNNGFAKIAIESLTKGHYLVQIVSENSNETLSFIKQ